MTAAPANQVRRKFAESSPKVRRRGGRAGQKMPFTPRHGSRLCVDARAQNAARGRRSRLVAIHGSHLLQGGDSGAQKHDLFRLSQVHDTTAQIALPEGKSESDNGLLKTILTENDLDWTYTVRELEADIAFVVAVGESE
jgi:hypothetical protein